MRPLRGNLGIGYRRRAATGGGAGVHQGGPQVRAGLGGRPGSPASGRPADRGGCGVSLRRGMLGPAGRRSAHAGVPAGRARIQEAQGRRTQEAASCVRARPARTQEAARTHLLCMPLVCAHMQAAWATAGGVGRRQRLAPNVRANVDRRGASVSSPHMRVRVGPSPSNLSLLLSLSRPAASGVRPRTTGTGARRGEHL
jgi:hypothetical protein